MFAGKNVNMKVKILAFLLFSVSILSLGAHPHMSIHYSCDFHFEESELKGAWINYQFDRFFSVDITNTYDNNRDGLFSEEESEEIYNHAFINLENYGFFISIRDNSGRASPQSVSDFSPWLDDEELLNYRFYIDLEENEERSFYLSIYDPTFFCATFMVEESPVTVRSEPPIQSHYTIEENEDFPVFYDPYAPASDTSTYTEWRPGLNTYFPEEIHFEY